MELKWAQSADGFMAATAPAGSPLKYRPVQLSTPFTRLLMHRERAGFDAIMAGTGTLLTDNPQLTCRLWPSRRLRPVVLKSPRTPADALVLKNPDTILIQGPLPLPELLSRLYSDFGITSLMVEGGPALLASFLREGIYEEIRIETAPVRLGRGLPAPQAAICKREMRSAPKM